VNNTPRAILEVNSFGKVKLAVFGVAGSRIEFHTDRLSDFAKLKDLARMIIDEHTDEFTDPNLAGDKIEIRLLAKQQDGTVQLSHWMYGSKSRKLTGHIAEATAYFEAMQEKATAEFAGR
jgi:hypothetical protein